GGGGGGGGGGAWVALGPSVVWLLRFARPAPPAPDRGGWWAHLSGAPPAPGARLTLAVTAPAGWPLAALGGEALGARRWAGRAERRWRAPAGGGALYLSTTPSWGALAAWLWARLGGGAPLGAAALGGAAGAARAGGVAGLHAWLRARVRYAPAPLRRFDAAPPALTLARGAGDCKDLSALAAHALRGAGRAAHVALTALAAPPPRAALAVPSMGWFDHALVWAPSPEERARALGDPAPAPRARGWLDATALTPAPAALHGRLAWALLGPEEGRWLTIDASGDLSAAWPTPR
ncbi:MAG: hypothetical protein FJ138_17735, partial [Deltaproteobacteria bacterium]|nr:hypothetical protein [Deltaproteobacteria bacterium]